MIRPFPPPKGFFFLPPAQADRHNSAGCWVFFCPPTTGIHFEGFGTMAGLVTRKLSPLISQNTPRSAQCAHTLFFFCFFCTSRQTHTNALLRNSCALFLGLDADACTQNPVFLSCRARLCVCVCGVAGGGDAEKPCCGKHEFECFRFALVFHSVPLGAQIASSRHSGFLFFPFFFPLLL